jgi:hypothetical protein
MVDNRPIDRWSFGHVTLVEPAMEAARGQLGGQNRTAMGRDARSSTRAAA